MSFDITSVLKGVSGSDTKGGKDIVYLPVDKIDPDPDNFYSLAGIEELADSIALIGLQQPLLVRPAKSSGATPSSAGTGGSQPSSCCRTEKTTAPTCLTTACLASSTSEI